MNAVLLPLQWGDPIKYWNPTGPVGSDDEGNLNIL